MSSFIGLPVRINLEKDKLYDLVGRVKSVENNKLLLRESFYIPLDDSIKNLNQSVDDNYLIKGSEITNLNVIDEKSFLRFKSSFTENHNDQDNQLNDLIKLAGLNISTPLTDPAILSTRNSSQTSTPNIQDTRNVSRSDIREINVSDLPSNGSYSTNHSGYYKDNYNDVTHWTKQNMNDVKQKEDFDFQSNLLKFDKKKIFSSIKTSQNSGSQSDFEYKSKSSDYKIQTYQHNENVLPFHQKHNINYNNNNNNNNNSLKQLYIEDGEKRPCPTLSARELYELENLITANKKYSLSKEFFNTNSGSAIASVVISHIFAKSSRLSYKNHNSPPIVLCLVLSYSRSGSRLLAAARTLLNHSISPIVLLLSSKRVNHNNDDSKVFKDAKNSFLACGGKLVDATLDRAPVNAIQNFLKSGNEPPIELIIDGLGDVDDLEKSEYSDLLEENILSVINWVNTLQPGILSIQLPTYYSTSRAANPQTRSHFINAKWVISLGVPLNSLLYDCNNNFNSISTCANKNSWVLYLADIGIPYNNFPSPGYSKLKSLFFGQNFTLRLAYE